MGRETLDAEHYWLRESVTLPYEGQSRTIEITVPVRVGASPEEVEALLAEVGDSMARLSRHLDAHVARALGAPEPTAVHEVAHDATQEPTPGASPASTAPTVPTSAPARARASGPLASPTPSAPATATSPAATTKVAAPTPAATPAATPAPARPASPPAPVPAASAGSTGSGGGELTRPQFIAAAAALGFNPKQAMDRLGVRTLEGLNLREALETLRRQELRGGDPADAAPTPGATPARNVPSAAPSVPERKAPASTTSASPARMPSASVQSVPPTEYVFDEEEDLAPMDALGAPDEEGYDLYGPGDASLPVAAGLSEPDAEAELPDGFDLDLDGEEEPLDAGDTGAPAAPMLDDDDEDEDLAPLRPLPQSLKRGRIAEAATTPAPESPARANASTDASASTTMSAEARSRVVARIGKLRTAQGGGAATPYQLNAYKNLVIGALGEPTATQLVRGLWNMSPAQLGSEQIAELVDWAKKDEDFEGEAQRVLAALRAQRERATQERTSAPRSTAPTGNTPRGPSAGGRPAPRRGGDA